MYEVSSDTIKKIISKYSGIELNKKLCTILTDGSCDFRYIDFESIILNLMVSNQFDTISIIYTHYPKLVSKLFDNDIFVNQLEQKINDNALDYKTTERQRNLDLVCYITADHHTTMQSTLYREYTNKLKYNKDYYLDGTNKHTLITNDTNTIITYALIDHQTIKVNDLYHSIYKTDMDINQNLILNVEDYEFKRRDIKQYNLKTNIIYTNEYLTLLKPSIKECGIVTLRKINECKSILLHEKENMIIDKLREILPNYDDGFEDKDTDMYIYCNAIHFINKKAKAMYETQNMIRLPDNIDIMIPEEYYDYIDCNKEGWIKEFDLQIDWKETINHHKRFVVPNTKHLSVVHSVISHESYVDRYQRILKELNIVGRNNEYNEFFKYVADVSKVTTRPVKQLFETILSVNKNDSIRDHKVLISNEVLID